MENEKNVPLEQAKDMAERDLQCNDKRRILSVRETDEMWIFTAGIPGVVSCGGRNMISINKASGEIKLFALPNKENFDLLHNSNIIYEYGKIDFKYWYYKGEMMPRELYETIPLEQLTKAYQALIDHYYHFNSKEEQIESMFKDFSEKSNYATRNYGKAIMESILKEKTEKEYTVKTNVFDITLNDVISYAVKDPFFIKAISDFFNKLEYVRNEDKIFFIISLYQVKDSFNEFTKELTGSQDANELFEKYKDVAIDYELMHRIDAYAPPNGFQQ